MLKEILYKVDFYIYKDVKVFTEFRRLQEARQLRSKSLKNSLYNLDKPAHAAEVFIVLWTRNVNKTYFNVDYMFDQEIIIWVCTK